MFRRALAWLDRVDDSIVRWMRRYGHPIERHGLSVVFMWFGLLKVFGQESATSIIAKTVYFGREDMTVIALGVWEVVIGVCFAFRGLVRLAILLLVLRLIGTGMALVLRFDVCFERSVFLPTIQGQYLIKDLAIIGAALAIGSLVRSRHVRGKAK